MNYKSLFISLLSSVPAALFAFCFTAQAATQSPRGYWVDSSGSIVRSGTGLCVRTGTWVPADAVVPGCDGVPLHSAQAATKNDKTLSEAPSAQPPAAAPAAQPATTPGQEPAKAPAIPAAITKLSMTTETSFGFDQASLKPESVKRLKTLQAELQNAKIETIIATGHTDSTGNSGYNKKLSLRRAQAVKDFLVAGGISPDRIFTEGKGATQPVASNKTSQGRARNRRVDVEVLGIRTP